MESKTGILFRNEAKQDCEMNAVRTHLKCVKDTRNTRPRKNLPSVNLGRAEYPYDTSLTRMAGGGERDTQVASALGQWIGLGNGHT